MPWIKQGDDDPDFYQPPIVGDHVLSSIKRAKEWRKYWSQHREFLLKTQTEMGKLGEIETARYYREEAADAMKQYRGWDAVIKWIDGEKSMNWPATEKISEEIALYVDRAFAFLDYELDPIGVTLIWIRRKWWQFWRNKYVVGWA